mmetsp:Transcript_74147/g.217588  ORF Transcript_74147/g.217588 Transcript_74147/m.217588 type:complete len:264 (-) Transcript_74147:21-812(-)
MAELRRLLSDGLRGHEQGRGNTAKILASQDWLSGKNSGNSQRWGGSSSEFSAPSTTHAKDGTPQLVMTCHVLLWCRCRWWRHVVCHLLNLTRPLPRFLPSCQQYSVARLCIHRNWKADHLAIQRVHVQFRNTRHRVSRDHGSKCVWRPTRRNDVTPPSLQSLVHQPDRIATICLPRQCEHCSASPAHIDCKPGDTRDGMLRHDDRCHTLGCIYLQNAGNYITASLVWPPPSGANTSQRPTARDQVVQPHRSEHPRSFNIRWVL